MILENTTMQLAESAAMISNREIAVALAALVEAAQDSETGYTIEQLKEMVETQALSEAGGFVSWVKRYFSGMDKDVLGEIREDIAKITTSKEKLETLAFVNKLIDNADEIIQRGGVSSVAKIGASAFFAVTGMRGARQGYNAANAMTDDLDGSIEAMAIGLAKVMRIDASFNLVIGVYAAARLVANILQYINKRNGTIHEYADALIQLKTEIEAIRV